MMPGSGDSDEDFADFVAKLDGVSRREFDSIMFKVTLHFHRDTQARLNKLETRVNVLFLGLGFLVTGVQIFGPLISKAVGF